MLTKGDIAYIKKVAHPMKPFVQIGKRGFSESLCDEVANALMAHEVIKIQFLEASRDKKDEVLKEIVEKTACEVVDIKGHVAILYKSAIDE